ncbi:MAG: hypothetical protein AAFY73_10135, partial [Pseudomonadota bacterium]
MAASPSHSISPEKLSFAQRLRMLWRVTSFRLTLIFMGVFLLFSILLISVSVFTVTSALHRDARSIITEELRLLQRAERRSGLRGLRRVVDSRSRAPGASLYLLFDGTGQVFAGNVRRLPGRILNRTGWINQPFEYRLLDGLERRRPRPAGPLPALLPPAGDRVAIARIVNLDQGVRLLVGRDFGQPERFRRIIFLVLTLITVSLAMIALLSWFFL